MFDTNNKIINQKILKIKTNLSEVDITICIGTHYQHNNYA